MMRFFGYAALGATSLLISLVVSFFLWGAISVGSESSGPGEGFGFILILMQGFPVWLTLAILTPIIARDHLVGNERRFARLVLSFGLPILSAVLVSIAMSWLMNQF